MIHNEMLWKQKQEEKKEILRKTEENDRMKGN